MSRKSASQKKKKKKQPRRLTDPKWHDRMPLTFKSVIVTALIGLFLWGLLDYIQSNKLQKIFHVQLVEKLTEQSMEYRLLFDRYIRLHHETSEIFISQKNFSDYINNQQWLPDGAVQIKYYDRMPSWFLRPSAVRMLASPRYAMLLDRSGRVREVYSRSSYESLPQSLLQPAQLLLLKSRDQSLIASIDSLPYLVTSEEFHDAQGNVQAILMLTSPVDEEFLLASIGNLPLGNYVSLVTPDREPSIIISSNHNELPAGTPLHTLSDRYIITGHQTYDYGSAEYLIKLVSLMSMAEADKLTDSVISTGRQQRNIIAPAFILTFAVFMIVITRRISRLNKRMSDFSHHTLGAIKHEVLKGDKLYLLERRFQRLTEEVVEAREMLKMQAEEKTRLIVNNARDAIVTIDSDGIITTWNPQAEVTFGWTHDEAVGRRIDDTIVPPQYRDGYRNSLKNFLAQGDTAINKQLQITALHRDSHEFPVELTISSANSEGHSFFIAIIRDISERARAEEKLQTSLKEKEVLIKEIHHRVKNNMQVISSLLNLQSEQVRDEQYTELLNDSRSRIKAMALVHEKLYQSDNLAEINFNDYIRTLTNGLFTFYGMNSARILTKIDVHGVNLAIDTAIPCGLIINELVSNAVKHAFPEGRPGMITISFARSKTTKGGREYNLTVSDNGAGIPEEIDIMQLKSLGLKLVINLVEHQLNGTIRLQRNNGSQFQINFLEPSYKKRV